MSIHAISWVFKLELRPAHVKFVLLALADCAGGHADAIAWPSIAAICEKTSQDRKTVISALDKLEALGLIADTHERRGATGQVKVYRLIGLNEDDRKRDSSNSVRSSKSSVSPIEGSRFSRESVPPTVHGTVREPEKEPRGESPAAPASSLFLPGAIGDSPKTAPEASRLTEGGGDPGEDRESGVEAVREPAAGHTASALIGSWNEIEGVRHALNVSDKRRRAAVARLLNPFFRENWVEAMARVAKSDFCRGGNERGWKADIDWFLQPDVVAKIMEGKYDNRKGANGAHRKPNGRGFEQQQDYSAFDKLG